MPKKFYRLYPTPGKYFLGVTLPPLPFLFLFLSSICPVNKAEAYRKKAEADILNLIKIKQNGKIKKWN